MSNTVHSIEIRNLWKKYDFFWENLNPDVNILIGINGSGKTTLFNIIDSIMMADVKRLRIYGVGVKITIDDYTVDFQQKMTAGELKTALRNVKYQKISTFPEEAGRINQRIKTLFETVDRLFAKTQKTIQIDPHTNHLIFIDDGEVIPLYKLSSGEKQLLLILMRVFLMEEQPYILLMDEPEISLHIEWQYKLFEEIRHLNPNCQIITSTHSPSLFGDGWGDKLVFVEDLIKVKS